MGKKDFSAMTDEELLVEKKNLKKTKILHAFFIGLLGGILIFGIVGWILSPNKHLGFIIPFLFPIIVIYRAIKNPNPNKDLEDALKERNLHG